MPSALPPGLTNGNDHFSAREREIIAELSQGFPNREIASRLGLAVNTVKDYLKTIYSKAGVHSARELIVQMYGNPEERAATRGQAILIAVIEDVLGASSGEAMAEAVSKGMATCLRGVKCGVWRVLSWGDRRVLAVAAAPASPRRMNGAFLDRIRLDGHAVLESGDEDSGDTADLAALGMSLPMLGLRMRLAPPPLPDGLVQRLPKMPIAVSAIVLVCQPAAGFGEFELSAARLLVRIAGLLASGDRTPYDHDGAGRHKPAMAR